MFAFLDRQGAILDHKVVAAVVAEVELKDIIHALGSLGVEALLQLV